MAGTTDRRIVDHVIIFVEDLDAAHHAMGALGFAGLPIGRHPNFGTINRTYLLRDSYIELLASEAERPEQRLFRRHFKNRGGLRGLALATRDAAATAEALGNAGILNTGPIDFSRDTPAGPAHFRTVALLEPTQFDAYVFFCEQVTPELVWRYSSSRHWNGAHALLSAVYPTAQGKPLPDAWLGGVVEAASASSETTGLRIGVDRVPDVGMLTAAAFREVRTVEHNGRPGVTARHPALGDVEITLFREART
jgi:hypothetical protein